MAKRIATFEFPEGSGRKWQTARHQRGGRPNDPPAVLIRSADDADTFALDYWRPVFQPEFVARVEAEAAALEPLQDGEEMEEADIAARQV
jgi:hypothetical protein